VVDALTPAELAIARDVVARYRDLELGLADASLVVLANRWQTRRLLTLDKHPNEKTPGDYPIAWCKEYGKGRVFYTSLGHREDVWDPNTAPNFKRENSKEVSELYQKHILGGIRWALGLEKGSARP